MKSLIIKKISYYFIILVKKGKNEILFIDFLVFFLRYVQPFHKQYQISMDHIIINEHHGMLLENDDDKTYYSLLSNVQQKSNLNERNVFFFFNQFDCLPSSRSISNSVVNNIIGGNFFSSSFDTSNGDIFGEIKNFKCEINS